MCASASPKGTDAPAGDNAGLVAQSPKPVKVLAFRVRNYMNIEAASVRLDEGTYEIFGDNADGKTAFMEAIVAAFAGKRGMVKEPIRKGAKQADWFVDTGEFTIERCLAAGGSMKLTVTAKNGNVYPHGQAFLDAFLNSLAFDPNAFGRMEPIKQAEILRSIAGVNLSPFDQRIVEAEGKRLLIGRERDSLKGQVDGCTWHEDAPAQQVSVAKLMNELDRRQKHNQHREQTITDARHNLHLNHQNIDDSARQLYADRDELRRLEALVVAQQKKIEAGQKGLANHQVETAALKDALASARSVEEKDENAIRSELRTVQSRNNKVMENERREKLLAEYQDAKRQYDDLSAEIESARQAKGQALAEAQFPVDGLTFDEAGVFYQGVPFSQISTGQRIRIGVQLFFASKPRLNLILVRDASLLDKSNRAVIVEEAARHGAQALLEVVGDKPTGDAIGQKRSFTIIDGRVEFDGRDN
jgi:hypothetical protein